MTHSTLGPIAGLRAAFERIAATRMADMPMNNAALDVEIVAFKPWEGCHVGVLITPWAINLAVVSDDPVSLKLTADKRRSWRFPSGDYDMMGGDEPECGAFQFCSLFSPAQEFADQAAAEATAMEIMRALLVAPESGEKVDGRETARVEGTSLLEAPVSRRGFLRGVFGTSRDRNP